MTCYGNWKQYLHGTWSSRYEALAAKKSELADYRYRLRAAGKDPKGVPAMRVRKLSGSHLRSGVYIVERCYDGSDGFRGLRGVKRRKSCACSVKRRSKR